MTNGSHMEIFFVGMVYGGYVFVHRLASLQNIIVCVPYALWRVGDQAYDDYLLGYPPALAVFEHS